MYYYIVNPAAGNSSISSIQSRLKTTLHRLEIDGEFTKTIGSGDALKITKEALRNGFKTIVAVGGGETVNEVVTAVHQTPSKRNIAVGIIPIGKQNILAKHLGITDWKQACEILSWRRLQSYQLLNLNQHVFIYSGAIQALVEESSPAEPIPAWRQYIFKPKTKPPGTVPFELKIDGKYKASGNLKQLLLRNQKFLQADLPNQLVVHVFSAHGRGEAGGRSLVGRLLSRGGQEASFSQLMAEGITATFPQAVQAVIDGRKIISKRFDVALADSSVQLITNQAMTEKL